MNYVYVAHFQGEIKGVYETMNKALMMYAGEYSHRVCTANIINKGDKDKSIRLLTKVPLGTSGKVIDRCVVAIDRMEVK